MDDSLPRHEDENNLDNFLYRGKDLRNKLKEDLKRIRDLMANDIEVRSFDDIEQILN